jgi:hypothetical protein
VTHVKAREWIKRLPARRGDDLDAGCKEVLQAHWDHVGWDIERAATGRECWPTAETIAEEIGSTVKAVRDRISKLRAAGWMRRDGRGWTLAWVTPFAVEVPPRSQVPPESDYHPSGERVPPEWHETTTAVASDYHPSGTKLSHEQSDELPHEPTPRAPETTSPGVTPPDTGPPPAGLSPGCELAIPIGSSANSPSQPLPVAELPESEAPGSSPPSPPTKPRKRKPPAPKPGQTSLIIEVEARETEDVAELLDLHERLRQTAQHHHGLRATPLPSPTSGDGRSLRLRLRKAVAEHGAEACRRALERRAAEWREDPGALSRWSTDSMWSPKSLAVSLAASTANGKRAGPSRTLPVEPDAPDRTYRWQD